MPRLHSSAHPPGDDARRAHDAMTGNRATMQRKINALFLADVVDSIPAKPATRCQQCGYWVQGGCATCGGEKA